METGWANFVTSVGLAEELARPETTDPRTALIARYNAVRSFAAVLLSGLSFQGVPACKSLLDALTIIGAGLRTQVNERLMATRPESF